MLDGTEKEAVRAPYRVFVYHHTHWDREWWATYQDFRIRLVELIDELLNALDEDPDFRCFLLDGQTIVLDDYLAIRPENRDKLTGYIRDNRIQCGPWYILPDEFLVSGEAHIRNLWLGIKTAEKYGVVNQDVGYIPDTFGHISQMPQLLNGFGIDNALVWRGLGGPEETFKQEFAWEAPNGSRVLAYWFPDGYYVVDFLHFDNPNKTYDETYGRVRRSLERWAKRATTDCLLMPYGGDHRLIDRRLGRLIRQVNEDLKGFAELRWSTTKEFVAALRERNPQLETIAGELRGAGADLPHLLPGVLSARMYLKRLNFRGQLWLERYAEPMSAIAWRKGRKYDASLLWHAWELLVQNHPHDSICGCSIDQVHREMMPRFDQSAQIAEIVTEKAAQHLNSLLDTSALHEGEEAIVVHNPLPWSRTDVATVRLEPKKGVHPRTHRLLDDEGNEVPFQVAPVEGRMAMTDKWFHTEVRFVASGVPGLGYAAYRLAEREKPLDPKLVPYAAVQTTAKLKGSEPQTDLHVGRNVLENRYLRVEASLTDGTLTVVDKTTGETYGGLNAFESSGDAGDTYNYAFPLNDNVLRTDTDRNAVVTVQAAVAGHASATLAVTIDWALPVGLTADRLSRSAERTVVRLVSRVTLAAESRRVDIATEWDNAIRDHRLRALFPLGRDARASRAEGHFDVVERPAGAPGDWGAERGAEGDGESFFGNGWPEPSIGQMPQQGYVTVSAEDRGLTVANKGLPEFELLRDGRGTIAVTLLRAVGWLSREDTLVRVGGAGPETPTPEAQCPGVQRAEYAIVPHAGDGLEARVFERVHDYLTPLYGTVTGKHDGTLPMRGGMLALEGDHTLLMSACKKAERSDALIVRLWNVAKAETAATVRLGEAPSSVRYVDLKEEPVEPYGGTASIAGDGSFVVRAGPAEIVTLEIRF
ncbi:alpha-mannosidase [Paenibacillus flagellatus]|nr:glycosyl hydrolase-related protein [Paenibacillus flagellatus]